MEAPNKDARARAWVLTMNNYTEDQRLSILNNSKSSYVIVAKEIGEETFTPHLQCYIKFPNAIRWSTLHEQYPQAWMEPARGSFEENFNYCTKDGDWEEQGNRPPMEPITLTIHPDDYMHFIFIDENYTITHTSNKNTIE